MAARLVPWTIAGLSLVVLGLLVIFNAQIGAAPASVSTAPAGVSAPPWIVGVGLVGLGACAALLAMFRDPHGH